MKDESGVIVRKGTKGKVGGLMILFMSGDHDHCDLTHESQYFDEKLKLGGDSHEMMEIQESVLWTSKHSVKGIYSGCGIYKTSELQMSHTRCIEICLPTGRKRAVTMVLFPHPRGLHSVQPVSVAVHEPEGSV